MGDVGRSAQAVASIADSAISAGATLGAAGLESSAARDAAKMQSDAARYASDQQLTATNNTIGLQRDMFNTQQDALAPYKAVGQNGLLSLNDMVSRNTLTPAFKPNFTLSADQVLQNDPGYQFRMDQGMQALNRQLAAGGNAGGGAAMKAALRYGQDYASNEYANAAGRYANNQLMQYNTEANTDSMRYNQLASLAGIGQTANAQAGGAAQNYATSAGNAIMGGAAASSNYLTSGAAAGAAGIMGAGNAWGGALGSIGNNAQSMYMLNQINGGNNANSYANVMPQNNAASAVLNPLMPIQTVNYTLPNLD